MNVGPPELLIVLAIALLLFGSTKLPRLARAMGQAAHEFRSGLHSENDKDDASHPSDQDASDR